MIARVIRKKFRKRYPQNSRFCNIWVQNVSFTGGVVSFVGMVSVTTWGRLFEVLPFNVSVEFVHPVMVINVWRIAKWMVYRWVFRVYVISGESCITVMHRCASFNHHCDKISDTAKGVLGGEKRFRNNFTLGTTAITNDFFKYGLLRVTCLLNAYLGTNFLCRNLTSFFRDTIRC